MRDERDVPDESEARLQDLILQQLAKAPSNQGFEDMQVERLYQKQLMVE